MFTKQESAQIKQEFWTSFGRYMQPIPSASLEPVSWVNYKTGIKGIRYHADAYGKTAVAAIEILHPDPSFCLLFLEQILQLRTQLIEAGWVDFLISADPQFLGKIQELIPSYFPPSSPVVSNGKISLIQQLDGFTLHNKAHWPELISFFKTKVIQFDRFWSEAKYFFEDLTQ